jgi:AraC-like DNA-binding protein
MPSSRVRTFTDPDVYHAEIRDTHAEGIITGRGNFRAEYTSVRLDRLAVYSGKESLPRITYSAFDPNLIALAFPIFSGPALTLNGLEASYGDIIAFRAGSTGYNRSFAACKWGSIGLGHEDLAAAGQTLIGRELSAPQVTHGIKPPPSALNRLLNLHEAAGHLAKTAPEILAKPEVGQAMEQALIEAMVSCLASGDPVNDRSAYRHHAKVMRRLEEVLRASSAESLYMDDLCKTIGVSYRTLHACCREHLSMGPKRYLILRRMHLARRALSRSDPEKTSVTEIATDYGFWELGRFSVVYRSLFGESPSTTLRRLPDDPGPIEIAGTNRQFAESA